MANNNSNFPTNQLNNLPDEFVSETVHCLRELAQQGKPQTITELKTRINDYFAFCESHDFRPGVETISLALGVSRVTFWKWCNSDGCDAEWSKTCEIAKQYILSFLEIATLKGRLNPASSIFLFKNWGAYKDSISFDEAVPATTTRKALTAADLPKLGNYNEENV